MTESAELVYIIVLLVSNDTLLDPLKEPYLHYYLKNQFYQRNSK